MDAFWTACRIAGDSARQHQQGSHPCATADAAATRVSACGCWGECERARQLLETHLGLKPEITFMSHDKKNKIQIPVCMPCCSE